MIAAHAALSHAAKRHGGGCQMNNRIVDAAGAYYEYGGPCLVVDFGTATTYDYVDANGNFD